MTTYPEYIPLESPIAAPSEVDDQFKQAARQFLDRIANEATVSVGASAPPLVFDDEDDDDDVEQPAIVTTTDKQVVDDRKAAPPLCLDDAPATDGAVLGDASDMPAEKVGLLSIIDKQIAELERTRAALLHCDHASVDSPPSAGAPVKMVTVSVL